jgi:hypothetical protein
MTIHKNNTVTVLDSVNCLPDPQSLLDALRIHQGSSQQDEFLDFLEKALVVARPKVIYKVAFIEDKDDSSVSFDGIRFESRVLRVNLDGVHRAFPYVVTCGMELETWQENLEDFLQKFWVDAIKEAALESAFKVFEQHLVESYQPGPLAGMNPGSLEDWPITQQVPLFALLGDVEKQVGVRLTDSCLMLPNKTVSGILFPAESSFVSCQLCPREICPNRRAPYEPQLYDDRYGNSSA